MVGVCDAVLEKEASVGTNQTFVSVGLHNPVCSYFFDAAIENGKPHVRLLDCWVFFVERVHSLFQFASNLKSCT